MELVIYLEGDADIRFLEDFVAYHFPDKKEQVSFINVGGKTSLPSKKKDLEEDSFNDRKSIVIFDADDESKPNGGKEASLTYLQNELEKIDISHIENEDIFLFPNHNEEGDLETLLEQLIPEGKRNVLACFSEYQTCLSSIRDSYTPPLNVPDNKIKMYAYGSLLGAKGSETARFYLTNHWDLDAEYAKPLYDFLEKYLK
ncbi:hypothetical protein EI427_05580 [Flammeovirga pectinis]|uniref:DUF4276 family protein n=1 Tax=Flammeovirga pectinis TaxID=2494373 RepID=A0A3S9P0L4_9BACT|nr:DUF3226 domain-containing protein [Flammeovirga pectinis]AZQ61722.1 hypothetical protein EI427_05580 [Flammeovirga pectinis]